MAHLTLVHGIGMSPRYWRPLARLLARRHEVLVPELPGFGSSPRPEHRMDVGDLADHVARLLDGRAVSGSSVGPTVVVGHSMGTQIAVELAVRRPDLVAGVVLIGPVTDVARRTRRRHAAALAVDTVMEALRTNVVVFTDYLRCGIRWYLTELTPMVRYPIERRIGLVRDPVLVVRGSLDPIAMQPWCDLLARLAPSGTTETLRGRPHNVQHGAPERVAVVLERFVSGLGR